jgi:hypothetical protein
MNYPNLYKVMNQVGQELVAQLKAELSAEKKVASGSLINSIGYDLVQTDKGWNVQITANETLKYVDQGRKPGKMPPSSALVPWVESKGISFTSNSRVVTTEQAAFVIARSIGEKGIKPTDVIETSMDIVFNNRKDLISEAVAEDIKLFILSAWNS